MPDLSIAEQAQKTLYQQLIDDRKSWTLRQQMLENQLMEAKSMLVIIDQKLKELWNKSK